MMKVDVTHDIKKLSKRLEAVEKKQIPFATSKAINATLLGLRKHEVKYVYPRSFRQKDPRFFGAVMGIDFSNKRNLKGSLRQGGGRAKKNPFSVDLMGFTSKSPTRGRRTPRLPHTQASSFSIPFKGTKAWNSRRSRGVSKAYRPQSLMRKGKSFIDDDILYEVKGRGGSRKVIPTYSLNIKSVQLPRNSFRYFEEGRRYLKNRFKRFYKAELKKALVGG